MLSRTGTYALQAALRLARTHGGAAVSAATIAAEVEVSRSYLAKVLHRLVQEGVLDSTRGPRGGYRLRTGPAHVTVASVVAPFQELRPSSTCLLGGPCDLDHPCPAHERRRAWSSTALELLESTTLADLLDGAPPTPDATSKGR